MRGRHLGPDEAGELSGGYDRVALRQLDERLLAGLSLLGLTPADRSRYGFGEVSGIDGLDEFRARVAARRAARGDA